MKTGNTHQSRRPRRLTAKPQWSPVMKTGNTFRRHDCWCDRTGASMEPGHEDREYDTTFQEYKDQVKKPQWSPVMKTGNTSNEEDIRVGATMPQWSPVMKTGNTTVPRKDSLATESASMEPGHEDREYTRGSDMARIRSMPQWSPVMKTGNTIGPTARYGGFVEPQWSPVMKTGNTSASSPARTCS